MPKVLFRRFIFLFTSNFPGEFNEATRGRQILATHDRDDQRKQRFGYVIGRGQDAAVSAENDFQQTRRRQREQQRLAEQRCHRRHVDQQQHDVRDADDAELNSHSVPI